MAENNEIVKNTYYLVHDQGSVSYKWRMYTDLERATNRVEGRVSMSIVPLHSVRAEDIIYGMLEGNTSCTVWNRTF